MTQVTHGLPCDILATLTADPALMHIVHQCIDEPEFIENFSRLYGVSIPRPPKNTLEAMVDEATGWRDDQYRKFFNAFIPFVHRSVYLPLKADFEKMERKS
ncbi:hypothetical protein [Pantoea sp.]|uniref:hypothetical protein n=1 Tax=Pantoea sp. TaxID=69393 RepID=UPI0028ADC54C|nr:hypothetical protein [Pantoea sp.]